MLQTRPFIRAQHGLITRRQARQAGLTDAAIRRCLTRGDWLPVRHGLAPRRCWQEKQRQDFISGFTLGVSRITAADCGAGRRAAERRLLRELEDTNARFGTDISDLAPYIVRWRR